MSESPDINGQPDFRRSLARVRVHGYTSGVFDCFHIGHLNILNAASELCDYLTVAVATDELATELKGNAPVIPLLERLEIVQSMRMVDNVVVQPNLDKIEAWRDLRFDVVFAGNNWEGNERWVAHEKELRDLGVAVRFLPYTYTTSSEILQRVHLSVDD